MAQVKISGLTAATAALTDLIEMESSGGLSGKITLQQVSDLFAASRVGELYVGIHSTAPASVLLFDGSTKARAAYPDLWEMIAAGRLPSVTNAAWLAGAVGAFSTGDGSTTFRLPDWRGVFLRGAGTNSILAMANGTKFTGGALAAIMLDAIQNITGSYEQAKANNNGDLVSSSGAFYTAVGSFAGSSVTAIASNTKIYFDASRVARTSAETRPASVSLNFGIYFE